MRSAREIAHGIGPAGGDGACLVGHTSFCDSRTEAILEAREDGARWMLEQVETIIRNLEEGEFIYPGTIADGVEPEDVRKVSP